ncbi:hypothetical protein SLEP1_g23499 [Rubroshorea leprosula]|uniref:Uncharacterized protein n=1 Tax=Rubroshorea leprosula TaxID=152421 RepID=A0AAV5JLS7_9ROSI|nr:hypothetical protein SLEP1_g23499 [Rubroshorea leprosula]
MILCELDKFRALCICGTLSQVYSVCHVSGFGFWGVTDLVPIDFRIVVRLSDEVI